MNPKADLSRLPAHIQALLEEIPLAVLLLDNSGGVAYCNPYLVDLAQWRREELLGRDWFDHCVAEGQRDAQRQFFLHGSGHGKLPAPQRGEMLARNGERYSMDWRRAECRDSGGRAVGVLAIGWDCAGEQRIEAELRESEERLRFVMEGSEIGLWDWDLATGEVLRNQHWAEMLGYRLDDIQFTVAQWSDFVHPDDREAAWQSITEHLLGKTPQHQMEYRMRTQSGAYKWIMDRAKVVKRGPDGRELRMCGTHTDIDARRHNELRGHARNKMLELLAKGAPLPAVLDALVAELEAENPRQICSILLLDDDGHRLLVGAAPSLPAAYNAAVHGFMIGPGRGSCGNTAHTGQRTIVEDIHSHPFWHEFKGAATAAGLGACWSEPIFGSDGKVLGTFAIYHREAALPCERDIQAIENAAHLAGIAIERKRIDEDLQMAALVYQNSSEAMLILDADNRIIGTNPAFTLMTGYSEEEVLGQKLGALGSRQAGGAAQEEIWDALNACGHWQGEIWNRRKNGEAFAEWLTINTVHAEDGAVHRRVALFSDITKKKQSDELIWRQANFDPITHLPNRRLFRERFEEELKKAQIDRLSLALLFIDLDRFKEVNDTLGHDHGDILLAEAAQRISQCVRKSDTVARLGGDEFTVILARLSNTGFVERIAKSINQKMAEPFRLGDERVYVSASIGITFYPEDAQDAEQLLKNADQAMYFAKKEGRNRFSYFTQSMQETAQVRLRLINDLRGALADRQFAVYFQPIVGLAGGQILKAEALLRWRHPVRGWIDPAEFIPLAEETGLIIEIGDWVLREAARWARRWMDIGPTGFQVSVNKSPAQFNETNLGEWLSYFREIGLPGKCMVIEITESLLLHMNPCVSVNLLGFHDAGMQVAIDDFGTGYSALSYLNKFHIDYLKLGQPFVNNLTSDASDRDLSEAIIMMAHKLGLKVIAEGVESAEQKAMLATAGCDYGQGYYFSRPLPPEEFEALLQNPPFE
ncbi:MAG: EAL domain-containing protein [Candidatus Methylumidiphilus sp.]